MTPAEMQALDLEVCRGLRKRPGESLKDRAKHVFWTAKDRSVRRAAFEIAYRRGDIWERMARAARLLKGSQQP